VYELSDGSGIVVTVGKYVTPGRRFIDQSGILPDFNQFPGFDLADNVVRYESFAKPVTKPGLLRVILYYLNPNTPPKNTSKLGFYPFASHFSITFCYYVSLLQFNL
jgi:hypothetical protein